METIDIKVQINAPIEKVFSVLSDHAGYSNFSGVQSAKLLKQGEIEKNGKGAIRQIDGPGITFIEGIPAFERNNYFEYKVLKCYLNLGYLKIDVPLHHELGKVSFKEEFNGTQVNWVSIIDLNIPFLKEPTRKVFSFMGAEGFQLILRQLKKDLEAA